MTMMATVSTELPLNDLPDKHKEGVMPVGGDSGELDNHR